ncbi:alpha/beta hydrolase [Tenacibaculum sp. IB213877]|uniref:alpha/beta fold hydrolase n=1 Tax=Tenacibaculum sp. IB213877 TaxID=3097351 RepID=UPI002A5ACC95|nr:alpha/beta hydrolase [Tenacibaculum sp. IB213877]MDY0780338.1 alpha/beta hydrolase [Tenacibaculum sp. IB213877]
MQSFINYKNIQVAYSSQGKGSAIVLLHGFLENSSMWKYLIEDLSKKNKVISIDLLGHGNTECLGYIHTMEEMADVVKAVLKSLKIRKSTFIGHSMGGYVALAFAEKYTKNIKGLCLMNSTAQADSKERKETRTRAIKMAQTNYKSLIQISVANLFAEESRELFANEIETCKQEALKTPIQGYIACSEGMKLRPNRESVLSSATFKKMIITGKNDPIISLESAQREAKRTQTPLKVLSHGHMSYIENKEELIKTLTNFIKN